jgi:signal transduction histidine kinase
LDFKCDRPAAGSLPGLPQGRYLHLLFQDTGRGIAPEDLPLVFEPYFTTKTRGSDRGTGLGLALCEAIIRSHRGAIQAESRPGEGAAFQLYLPVQADGS